MPDYNKFTDIEIIDEHENWDKFYNNIKKLKEENVASVGVGFFDNDKILDKAYKQEFGDPPRSYRPFNIPQRSFLRHVFDTEIEIFYNYMKKLSEELFDGKIKIKELLNEIGEFVESEIINFIEGPYYRMYKPNAKITILKKGHDQPLIGTGEMVENINHKLFEK